MVNLGVLVQQEYLALSGSRPDLPWEDSRLARSYTTKLQATYFNIQLLPCTARVIIKTAKVGVLS